MVFSEKILWWRRGKVVTGGGWGGTFGRESTVTTFGGRNLSDGVGREGHSIARPVRAAKGFSSSGHSQAHLLNACCM